MMALGWPRRTDSLMLDMVRIRRAWMREVLTRDTNFIGDAAILGHTINSASFFGSANLIVIVAMSSALFIQPTAGLQAGIFSIPSGGERSRNAVWTYESPHAAVAAIKDRLAFYPDRVDSIEEIRP
ncbi:DUF599 family protein [Ensifer sp. 22460]|uniref:DUF599 family protein n=1 Tax=Ensifer sp. 22460 TaxID=3453922 RepID=UPI003F83AFB9